MTSRPGLLPDPNSYLTQRLNQLLSVKDSHNSGLAAPGRESEGTEDMTVDDESSVYVGGLPYDTTEDSLRKTFSRYGSVVAVKVLSLFSSCQSSESNPLQASFYAL